VTVSAFTALFVIFVLSAVAWRTWLGVRQARHVQRHRDRVPPDFEAFIPIEAHNKAADYTLDKQRIGLAEAVAIDAALLLGPHRRRRARRDRCRRRAPLRRGHAARARNRLRVMGVGPRSPRCPSMHGAPS
jgi:hypothetical protein